MDSATTKQLSKTLSDHQLVMNAFSALPLEVAMEILEYVPIKIYFEPKELTFYKDQLQNCLLLQNDFQMIPDALRRNSDFMNRLIRRNPKAKEYVIEPMVNEDCSIIHFNQDQYDYYRKFMLKKISNDKWKWCTLNNMPIYTSLLCDELRGDKEVVLAAVKIDARALQFASDNLKNDKKVMLAAVRNNAKALQFAPDDLKNDKEIVLTAVRNNGETLKFASDNLKNDKKVMLAAVQKRGKALQLASDDLKNDKEIVLTAVRNNGKALQFASDDFKNDREIVLTAVRNNGETLKFLSENLKNDIEIVSAALRNDRYHGRLKNAEYASDSLKDDIRLICSGNSNCLIRYDPDAPYPYYCTCKTEYVLKELQNLKDKRNSVATSPKLRKNLWEAVLDRLGACFKMTHPQESE